MVYFRVFIVCGVRIFFFIFYEDAFLALNNTDLKGKKGK